MSADITVWSALNGVERRIGQTDRTTPAPGDPVTPSDFYLTLPATLPATFE